MGEIVDSFISGKVIELGVIDILKKINGEKDFFPDIEVRSTQDYSDPDIVAVKENEAKREPKVFVEIKNDLREYRWTGLYKEQFESMQNHKSINGDIKKIFIVYASLKSKKEVGKERNDLFGIYLKSISDMSVFKDFSVPSDLYVEINHVITGEELVNNGDFFNKDEDFIYETDVLKESSLGVVKADGSLRKGCEKIVPSGNKIPTDAVGNHAEKIGEFTFSGNVEVYKVKFRNSYSIYIKCISDVVVKNKILGKFDLEGGKQYQVVIKKLMQCGRNNLWIAKRNLEFVTKSNEARMFEIAEKI
ncbi:hypothetical protein YTPLAS73_14500 [Nitrosarchaeum sp.]|nr:hypothetical protein YTPLAS73_14500 [Nitrosarchaeum sp.]